MRFKVQNFIKTNHLMCSDGIQKTIHIMKLSVLQISQVTFVLGHGHLGAVEHGRLVHVVRGEHIQSGPLNYDTL